MFIYFNNVFFHNNDKELLSCLWQMIDNIKSIGDVFGIRFSKTCIIFQVFKKQNSPKFYWLENNIL